MSSAVSEAKLSKAERTTHTSVDTVGHKPAEEAPKPKSRDRLSLPDALSELNTMLEEIKALWPLDEMATLAAKLRTAADHIRNELK